MAEDRAGPGGRGKTADARKMERLERQAKALRENLKRRKEQDRARRSLARSAD